MLGALNAPSSGMWGQGRPGLQTLQQGASTRSPEDSRLLHLDAGLSSLDGRVVPMPQGDYESGECTLVQPAHRQGMQPGSGGPVATAYPRPGLGGLIHQGGGSEAGVWSDGGWSPDANDPQG